MAGSPLSLNPSPATPIRLGSAHCCACAWQA